MAIFRNFSVTMVFIIDAAVGVDRFSATSGTGKISRPACVVRRVWSSGGDGFVNHWIHRRTDVIPSTCFEAKKIPADRCR